MTTYIDLFSGIGGCRLAAEAEGLRCVLSVDHDPDCGDIQEVNFGQRPVVADIRHLPDDAVPPADLLIATPPCTPYSMQGLRQGFADPRAWCWWDVLRVLRASRPRVLLLENVPGLVYHDRGMTVGAMAEHLWLSGYRSRWEVIRATRVGAAQHRPRLYLVASRLDRPAFDFGRLPLLPPSRLRGLLAPGPHDWLDPAGYTLLDTPVRQPSGLMFAGFLNRPPKSPPRDPKQSRDHYIYDRIYDAGGVHPTLLAQGGCGVRALVRVGDRVRELVPLELLRLQGFPDTFRLPDRGRVSLRLGNSAYVPLVRLLLKEIVSQLLG